MTAFDPDPSHRWLFCLTHPDDEISICAWIRRCVSAGAEVSMAWTHSKPVREKEARAVAALLGVKGEKLYFFGATDGRVCDEMPELLPKFREMMASVKPTRVCCGAFEQGHIDHDATNLLVNRTFRGPVFEIPFYHVYAKRLQTINRFSNGVGQELIHLNRDEQRLKGRVARKYPSQNIWSVLAWYHVWQGVKLRPSRLAKTERMRLQTHKDFMRPNHPARFARLVTACPTWKRWQDAVCALPDDLAAD